MRHRVAGKHLNRSSAHRKALRMNFAVAVIKHERVTTTLAKAKAMRGFVEKLITLARKDDPATRLHRIRQAATVLRCCPSRRRARRLRRVSARLNRVSRLLLRPR